MHDIRPLECERTRHFLSVRLDDGLSHFERLLVDAHLAGCEACVAYGSRIAEVTTAIRAAPLEPVPTPVQLPERRRGAWRSVVRATSVAAAASLAIAAFLGFAAAPDRSAWHDDHALIAAALDQPSGTNDLLIDVLRPTLAAREAQRIALGTGGLGAVKPLLQPGL
jgi:anti-sigma factor RsiW